MSLLFATFFVAVLTGCALLCALWANRSELRAAESALRAEASEVRLKVARSDVLALQAHVGRLDHTMKRVEGRVYATTRRAAPDDIAGQLMESDDPRARQVGQVHAEMGVGIAAPSPKECACGWCQTCEERKLRDTRRHTGVIA